MPYDVNYELCALVMLVIILIHLKIQNSILTFANRIFRALVILGVFNIVLDILSTVLISFPRQVPVFLQSLTLHIFYILQLLLPYMFYLYVRSLHGKIERGAMGKFVLGSAGFLVMLVLVLTNPLTHVLFFFDETGQYTRGKLYLFMYYNGLLYIVQIMLDVLMNRKEIAPKYVGAVLEFMIINLITVALQAFYNDVLLTGVGIAMSLVVLLLTINNPYARTDTLTKLFDAAGLKEALYEGKRRHWECWMIAIACDNVKRINLVFGTEEGNRQLQYFADALASYVGRNNAFRFVGGRFVALCHSREGYERAVGKIRRYFAQSKKISGMDVRLSACICCIPNASLRENPEELIDFMDYLVEKAKKLGRGKWLETDAKLEAEYARSKMIEAYLMTAIREKRFEVYYQPLYSLRERRFVSVEALVRLRHAQLGMLSPSEFIPIAESNGEIAQVERCILEKVCQFMQRHPESSRQLRTVKVNLSPASFLNANLAESILKIIADYALPPSFFQFEITETAATVHDHELLEWTERMKNAGAGLCLDDFGSGFANLDVVVKLPFDVVKIDRSMLMEARQKPRFASLYENLVITMRQLGFEVVAEGAETQTDIDLLSRIGVDSVQGYYHARPMPEADLLKMLAET